MARRCSPAHNFSSSALSTSAVASSLATAPGSIPLANRSTKEYDEVHRACFIDRSAIQWNCDVDIPSTSPTFHSDSRVMLVCSAAILYYDFITETAKSITTNDLGKTPCCAEFVYSDLCAIGCNDGQIRWVCAYIGSTSWLFRIWDCNSWSTVKTLTGHPRGDLIALRNLLPHR